MDTLKSMARLRGKSYSGVTRSPACRLASGSRHTGEKLVRSSADDAPDAEIRANPRETARASGCRWRANPGRMI